MLGIEPGMKWDGCVLVGSRMLFRAWETGIKDKRRYPRDRHSQTTARRYLYPVPMLLALYVRRDGQSCLVQVPPSC